MLSFCSCDYGGGWQKGHCIIRSTIEDKRGTKDELLSRVHKDRTLAIGTWNWYGEVSALGTAIKQSVCFTFNILPFTAPSLYSLPCLHVGTCREGQVVGCDLPLLLAFCKTRTHVAAAVVEGWRALRERRRDYELNVKWDRYANAEWRPARNLRMDLWAPAAWTKNASPSLLVPVLLLFRRTGSPG